MKYLFSTAIMASFVSFPALAADIAAIRIHADWCPKCKLLDPKLEAVKAELGEGYTVRHVRLDYTARDKEALWSAADTAGIKEPLKAYVGDRIKTGLLILIDEDTGEVVGKATADFSEAELAGALKAAANS